MADLKQRMTGGRVRPPKGFKKEPDVPAGGLMARFITRRGTTRALSRLFKRAQRGTGSLLDVKDIARLKGVQKTLKTGKGAKLRRKMIEGP